MRGRYGRSGSSDRHNDAANGVFVGVGLMVDGVIGGFWAVGSGFDFARAASLGSNFSPWES